MFIEILQLRDIEYTLLAPMKNDIKLGTIFDRDEEKWVIIDGNLTELRLSKFLKVFWFTSPSRDLKCFHNTKPRKE